MNRYVNPGNDAFRAALKSKGGYIDKTGLVREFSASLGTQSNLWCVSRPRRFGKSLMANTLAAYYCQGCDSSELFNGLELSSDPDFLTHLNKYPVICIDMASILTICGGASNAVPFIMRRINAELKEQYSVPIDEDMHLSDSLMLALEHTGYKFIFIIDEWDAICREAANDVKAFDDYITFLRSLFKSEITQRVFAGVYMTGILPIKKYGTQSALNNFDEYTMLSPGPLAPFFGFTEAEVKALAEKHDMPFNELKRWYDGYNLPGVGSIYNPNSVMKAIANGYCEDYWARTSSYEIVKDYISMNFAGLKDDIILMLSGGKVEVNPIGFRNDFKSIGSREDVLTLLIHLGYLGFDRNERTAFVPNLEISDELSLAVKNTGWEKVAKALIDSDNLLKATLSGDADTVAKALETVHEENTSILMYNNENSLSCAVTIAYYAARRCYDIVREFPSGKGYADLVFLPAPDAGKPAMVVELKYSGTAGGALTQIKERNYPAHVASYTGEIVLVGINYDRDTKQHSCTIERISK